MIKLNGEIIECKHFNDKTSRILLPIPENKRAEILWLFDSNEEIISIFYLISHLKSYKCYVKLNIPFFPNARLDKSNSETEVFTLKYFCNLLNSLEIDDIEVFDVHSTVTSALLNHVKSETPKYVLQHLLNDVLPHNVLIAYPDAGSEKRYSAMLRLPYIVGVKERDWEDGSIRKLQILGARHMVAGGSFLLVDDIISRGSTARLALIQLRELGAQDFYIYASHVEPTVTQYGLLEQPGLKKIYTTNSLWRGINHPKVEIIKYFD